MSRILYACALLLTGVSLNAQEFPYFEKFNMSRFPIDSIPEEQHFGSQLYVSSTPQGLVVSEDFQLQNVTKLKIGSVEYVGTNNGEWGGSLVAKYKNKEQKLLDGNIVHLQLINNSLYIVEGLAHLSLASGSVHVVSNPSKPEVPRLLTKFPDAPQVVLLDSTRPDFQRLVIVGHRSLMSIDPFETLNILYWDAFWNLWLIPTSIARHEENYFIGLPYGVAVVPAPLGVSSHRCRENSKYQCSNVIFYATQEFHEQALN